MNAPDQVPEIVAPTPTTATTEEPYESPKHFAAIFCSELQKDMPAKLRPVKKNAATIGAMEKAIASGQVTRDTATIRKGAGAEAITVYIVKDPQLEREFWPYVVVK
jgi:hypothetical protein